MEDNLSDREKERLERKRQREEIVKRQKMMLVAGLVVLIVILILLFSRVFVGNSGSDAPVETTQETVEETIQEPLQESTPSSAMVQSDVAEEAEPETEAPLTPEEQALAEYEQLGIANVTDHLNIRESAASETSIVGRLPAGGACEILGEEGDWMHISSGGIDGYVQSQYLWTGDEAREQALNYLQPVEETQEGDDAGTVTYVLQEAEEF